MPITPSSFQASLLQTALISGAAVAAAASLLMLLIDPTSAMHSHLDKIEPILARAAKLEASRATKIDASRMAQNPIFVMTSGAAAYKEKAFQLFGVSVSAKRKAALVAIDGAAPSWISVGAFLGDVRLIDVGSNGAVFETPVGTRSVSLSDLPPAAAVEPQSPVQ